MPLSAVNPIAVAYALEARTWLALEGRIPGHPAHDPKAWAAWRSALHAALAVSAGHARRAAPAPGPGLTALPRPA